MQEGTILYKHYDADDVPIYYGISDDNEIRQEYHGYYSMWHQFADHCVEEVHADRAGARRAERAAIAQDEPKFNKAHNTPGYEERLVRYLIDKGRLDLLQPREPKKGRGGSRFQSETLAWIRSHPRTDDGRYLFESANNVYAMTEQQALRHYTAQAIQNGLLPIP